MKTRHSLLLVRAMAGEAVVGKNRADLPIKIDGRARSVKCRQESQSSGDKDKPSQTHQNGNLLEKRTNELYYMPRESVWPAFLEGSIQNSNAAFCSKVLRRRPVRCQPKLVLILGYGIASWEGVFERMVEFRLYLLRLAATLLAQEV
jgi:hypothetical protein